MPFKRDIPFGHQAFQGTNPEKAMEAIATVSRETGLNLTRPDNSGVLPEGHVAYRADSFKDSSQKTREASFGRQMTQMRERLTRS